MISDEDAKTVENDIRNWKEKLAEGHYNEDNDDTNTFFTGSFSTDNSCRNFNRIDYRLSNYIATANGPNCDKFSANHETDNKSQSPDITKSLKLSFQ